MEAIKELVKLGIGASIMPLWTCRKELDSGALVALPLDKRKRKRRWGVPYWKGRCLTLAEETFIGLCESACERLR